jgi:diaminopimelate decarboxylase
VRYAVKANPNRELLRRLSRWVDSFDISSAGELKLARQAGIESSRLSLTGPAKSRADLQLALDAGCGEIVLESAEETADLEAACQGAGRTAAVLVRVNPRNMPRGFGVSMAGRASQFGVDEEELDPFLEDLRTRRLLHIKGFHVYCGTQCLDAAAAAENLVQCLDLFRRASHQHDLIPGRLVLGAGFGIPYDETSQPLDLNMVARLLDPALDELASDPRLSGARLSLELGRYLVGEAGYFLAGVVRIKRTRGREICILDGGMNHHLAACGLLGNMIRRNYPIRKVCGNLDQQPCVYDLVGPLCTTIDRIGHEVTLPRMKAGDVIAVLCSGAYGLTASPLHFISQRKPRELLLEGKGSALKIVDVTAEGSPHVMLP